MTGQKISIRPGMLLAILGVGVSGRAAARYALQQGARVLLSDLRPPEKFLAEEGELAALEEVRWEAGGHTVEFLREAELLLVSPGIDRELPLLRALREAGVQIAGELAVAARKITVPVIAVTGTNGKTTVTTLIGQLLTAANRKVFVGGNIGRPLYEYLHNPADYNAVVAELSSFQLEQCGDFVADIGVLLNITPDHLDRHRSLAAYAEAKANLLRMQGPSGIAIVNGDDPLCAAQVPELRSRVLVFGTGVGHTARITGDRIVVRLAGQTEEYLLANTVFRGEIGAQNAAAAILAACAMGCREDEIRQGLAGFTALPHRVELVATIDGVSYYNDSKATNTGAVIAALQQFPGKVILIAGGRDKGEDYRMLREKVAAKVKRLILLGESAPMLAAALDDLTETVFVKSMDEAVQQAADVAGHGDVVLLSPACASFDMFNSYGHRGKCFAEAVHNLSSNWVRVVGE